MGCFARLADRIPARYVLCLMLFLGFVVSFLLRVNINLTIVAMVKPVLNVTSDANKSVALVSDIEGQFEWDQLQQSLILGSFFWGYLVFQIPAGRIVEILSVKHVLGTTTLINAILCLLIPSSTKIHWSILLIIRALQGLSQGFLYPVLSRVVILWVPVQERARFITFVVQGASLGTVVALPMCGTIATAWGWSAVFYICGFIALAWVFAWWVLVFDSPEQHPRLTQKEKIYLRDNLTVISTKMSPVPWKKVLTSWKFIVACIASVGNDWGFHTFFTMAPKYIKEYLGFNIEQSSWLTSLPFLCLYVFALAYGTVADAMLKRNIPVIKIRKFSVVMSHIVPAFGLVVLTLCERNTVLSMTVLTLSITVLGTYTTGFFQTPIDIAPNFAGSLTGLLNAIGSLTGIVCTPVAGAVLHTAGLDMGWKIIFWISAALYFTCSLPFLIFGTTKIQHWNAINHSDKELQQMSKLTDEKVT